MNKQNFLLEVNTTLEHLRELTYPKKQEALKARQLEEEQKKKKQHVRTFQLLKEQMGQAELLRPIYGQIVIGILTANFSVSIEKVVRETLESPLSGDQKNHYISLPQKLRLALFYYIQARMVDIDTYPAEDYKKQMEPTLTLTFTNEKDEEFLEHLKYVALVCMKGYVFKNNGRVYIHEALPSLCWILEHTENPNLHLLDLFARPTDVTAPESELLLKDGIRKWYRTKGNKITSFEEHLNTKLVEWAKSRNYKAAQCYYLRYKYLFKDEFATEKESQLLSILYAQYQQCLDITDVIQKEKAILLIREEIMSFQSSPSSEPILT